MRKDYYTKALKVAGIQSKGLSQITRISYHEGQYEEESIKPI